MVSRDPMVLRQLHVRHSFDPKRSEPSQVVDIITCFSLRFEILVMASGIALPLANVLIGISGISTSIGFTIHEKALMNELKEKAEKLHKDITDAADVYERVYYVIAVNLERLRKAADNLPNDFVKEMQGEINPELQSQYSMEVLNLALGFGGSAFGTFSGINRFMGGLLGLVKYWRSRLGDSPTPPTEEEIRLMEPTTLPRTAKFDKLLKGLSIGQLVFAVAGLAAVVAIGIWTEKKLEKAIADVEDKQKQVSAFQRDMEKVLDEIVKNANLPSKNAYEELKKLAAAWKELSQLLESYAARMCYAIQGYFTYNSLDEVTEIVLKHTEVTDKTFPLHCYDVAKTLADEIRSQFDKGRNDKEIVSFFAAENPKEGLRFIASRFFIGSLREIYNKQINAN